MKQAKLLSVFILILLATTGMQAFATKVYTPSTYRSMSANKVYCLGATPTIMRSRYYICNTGTGTGVGTTLTVRWYRNTVNSTSGGTLVSTSTVNTQKNTAGSVTYTPSTATAGVFYYYTVITWTGAGTCNTSGSLTSGAAIQITVSESPSAISGTPTLCTGNTTTLTNTASGGTWTSSNTSKATVGATTGVVTGVAAGTARITYKVACGTKVYQIVTVTATPTVAAIGGGNSNICVGSTTTLTNATSGGVWSSGATSIATVGTSGIVTGVASGIATISYTVNNGCGTVYATKDVTVTAAPAAITGNATTCTGYTLTYSNTVPYGIWTSGNTARATIDDNTGVIDAITAGTVVITYNTGCGSQVTKTLTVNSGASAITGTKSICTGGTSTLANGTAGGTWVSSNTGVATIGTSSGIMTGISNGTATITYATGSACTAVTTVTINAAPAAISGANAICTGTTTTYTNTVPYGAWSSSATGVATVVGSTGVITGVAQGTARMTYTTGCGTAATKVISVNTQPGAITGTASVCESSTTTLANATSGGVWSSENSAVASVSSGGVVTGVSDGNADITYTNGVCYVVKEATVNPLPDAGAIDGDLSVCDGDETELTSDGDEGGNWTSSTTSVATVDATGTVTAKNPGTASISYSVTNGCGTRRAISVVTVNALPDAGTITGTLTVCQSATTSLTSAAGGGVWSSSNTSAATVGTNGVVTGVAGGTATITYDVTTGCGTDIDTKNVTVNALPSAGTITGTATVCPSATTTLSNATGGGAWSSSNTGVATVSGGVVTGVAAGTTTISYAVTNSCGTTYATRVVTVNALPNAGAITGTAVVCQSAATTLNNAAGGGAWSSSNTGVATVSAGVVTGVAAGNATISYVVTNSCGTATATQVATVNPLPNAGTITGTAVVCVSDMTTLSNAAGGGAWSSSNTGVATVSAGVVTGVAAGNATISYVVTNSCGTATATQVATVNPLPNAGAITGTAVVCESATTTLNNAAGGGAWSTSNAGVATVSAGVVTGVAAGNATISYEVTNSCGTATATQVATVNPLPSVGAITGTLVVCESATTSLSNSVGGGAWSSSNTSAATVSGGVVTGVAAGNATISYVVTNSCGTATATEVATVNPLPNAGTITGTATVCASAATDLDNAATGGVWSSSDAAVATVGTDGVVSGIAAGNATISYEMTNSCGMAYATQAVVVNALPDAGSITGTTTVCTSATTDLDNATTGGVWSSSNASVATVGTDGVVSGIASGNATITYTSTTSCGTAYTTQDVSVITVPSAGTITGTAVVCAGSATDLDNATTGGAWSSSNTSVATVDADGIVTGVAAGNATISYTATNSCGSAYATQSVTVNASSATISGDNTLCLGGTTTFTIPDAGGAWSSGNGSVATVNSATGVISSVSLGSVVITYTASTGCFYSARAITVNSTVASITGADHVCIGQATTLSNTTPAGTWSSSNTAVAAVDANTGEVTGVSSGSVTMSYTIAGGCYTTSAFIVYVMPDAITGLDVICTEGVTSMFASAGGSGVWTSSDPAVATVSPIIGTMTGVSAGTTTLTYTLAYSGCYVTKDVTVNQTPASITGFTPFCNADTRTFTNATSGGTWTSYRPEVATVDASTGVVTGVSGGGTIITYTVPNGCYRTFATTINALPASIAASGSTFNICLGASTTLSSSTTGGTWTSGSTSVAIVGSSTGVAVSQNLGTSIMTYTAPNSCITTRELTVYSAIAAIAGNDVVCKGYSTPLTNATSGGTWISSNTASACINSITGVVTGMNAGTVNISYKLGTGCIALKTMSVGAITGVVSTCIGSSTTLNHIVAGGTWSISNTARASIDENTGVVTGLTSGTAIVTYRVSPTIYNVATIMVNALPAAISGLSAICVDGYTTFTPGGGSARWLSSDTAVASINYITGLGTGRSAGTTTLTYIIPATGCYTTRQLTVLPTPAVICGSSTVCTGSTITLNTTPPDGIWTSTNTSVATVGSLTGIVTGKAGGGVNIKYTATNGCARTKAITVNATPGTITGATTISHGATAMLSCATTGGTWTSANTDVAVPATTSGITGASTSGLMLGVGSGTATISYTMANGCFRTANVTVTGAAKPGAPITTATENEVEFRLYPNPTNGAFTIESGSNGVLAIYTFDGKLVGEHTISDKMTSVSLPNNLAAGIYICQFRFEDGTGKTVKLIYQN